jgi:hypothetical protein
MGKEGNSGSYLILMNIKPRVQNFLRFRLGGGRGHGVRM